MLERLETINWEMLGHKDVPNWLRGLISPDGSARVQADTLLDREVVQSDVFEGYGTLADVLKNNLQALIVPFLIEILASATTQDKHLPLYLLDGLCFYFTLPIPDHDTRIAALLANLREEITEGISLYLSLIGHRDTEVRRAAVTLVSRFEECDAQLLEAVSARVMTEPNTELKLSLLWLGTQTAAKLGTISDEQVERWLDVLNTLAGQTKDDDVRVVASVCLITLERESVSPEAVDIVCQAFKNLESSERYLGFEWEYDFYRFSQTLMVLGVPLGLTRLLDVFADQQSNMISVFHAIVAAWHLAIDVADLPSVYIYRVSGVVPATIEVRLASRSERIGRAEELTQLQKTIIRVVVNNPRIWNYQTNLFSALGLPETRAELAALAGKGTR